MIPTLTHAQITRFFSKNPVTRTSNIEDNIKMDIIFSTKFDMECLEEHEQILFTPAVWHTLLHYYIDQSHRILIELDRWPIKLNQLAFTLIKSANILFFIPINLNSALLELYILYIEKARHSLKALLSNTPSPPENTPLTSHWTTTTLGVLILCALHLPGYVILPFIVISLLFSLVSGVLFSIGFATKILYKIFQPDSSLLSEISPFADRLIVTSGIINKQHMGVQENPKAGLTLFKEVMETHLQNLNALQEIPPGPSFAAP